jgi:D-3-phosphoglycerate dehydrogenase
VEIAFEGDVSRVNVKPLTSSALAGILRPMLEEVNIVSAPAIARERGITVTEARQELSPTYDSLMRITVTWAGGRFDVAGTVIGGSPRIVRVKGMNLDAPFSPDMLYVNNWDRPGFIGRLGAVFGDAGVNINTFYLGRTAETEGADAIALVGVDQEPTAQIVAEVKALPNVKEVRTLEF